MIKTFPAVVFVSRHGRKLAVLAALASIAIMLAANGFRPGYQDVAVAVVVALIVWAVLRLGAELIEVIAETLLPR